LSKGRAKHAFVKRMKGERDMREMDEIEYQNSDANSGNGKYAHKGDLMTRNMANLGMNIWAIWRVMDGMEIMALFYLEGKR
jgi:hypothetical protein